MMIEEFEVRGIKYRGPFPTNRADLPWKITALLPSDQIGESGQEVKLSWQTYLKFKTAQEAKEKMEALKKGKGER